MTLPNFLLIGAAKSGTTALYTYIKQHPEVFMATPKELRFFSYQGPYPVDLNQDYIHAGVTTLEDYEHHFDKVKAERIIGEASPMYLYYKDTAKRIQQVIPDVKMLAILRNPVDRAFSAYTHALRDWKEDSKTFEEALAKERERIDAGWDILWHYTKAGFYYKQLVPYFDIFNPDQIKVVLYDDLVADPHGLLQNIFGFLAVDKGFSPNTSRQPNISGFPKSTGFHEFMRRVFIEDNIIKRISRKIFPKSLRQKLMVNLREANLEKRSMPEKIKKDLIDMFYDDMIELEKLINRDLSNWFK
jgi:hypothetical protein